MPSYKKIPRAKEREPAPEVLTDSPLTKHLPWWDYKIRNTILEKEYGECRKIESKYKVQLHKFTPPKNLASAQMVCDKICAQLGLRQFPHLYQLQGYGNVAGYCRGKDVVIQEFKITWVTVLHELSHYIVYREGLRGIHDGDFLWVLDLVFQAFLTICS